MSSSISRFDPERMAHPAALEELDLYASQAGYNIVGRFSTGCLRVQAEGNAAILCVHAEQKTVSVRTVWNTGRPFPRVEYPLFAATDSWNRQHHYPTLYTVEDRFGDAVVVAELSVLTGAGISEDQLDEAVQKGLGKGALAISFVRCAAGTVLRLPELSK